MKVPQLRFHAPSNQWYIFQNGKRHYLGAGGTPEKDKAAADAYRATVDKLKGQPAKARRSASKAQSIEMNLAGALAIFLTEAVPSMEIRVRAIMAYTLGEIGRTHGHLPPDQFRVRDMETFVRWLQTQRVTNKATGVRDGRLFSRQYLNRLVGCVRTAWRWMALRDLVPAECAAKVCLVKPPRIGLAPEAPKRMPVPDLEVARVLAHAPPALAAMILVQRMTGMRPGELVGMTAPEIDRTGREWCYRPAKHKNAWRGHVREVWMGAECQDVLRPWLTTLPFKNDDGTPYTVPTYQRAIARACGRAGLEPWHPYQLRHARATEVRRLFGPAAADDALGHSAGALIDRYTGMATSDGAREVARKAG